MGLLQQCRSESGEMVHVLFVAETNGVGEATPSASFLLGTTRELSVENSMALPFNGHEQKHRRERTPNYT